MQPRREFGFSVAGKRRRSPEFPCVSRFRQRRLISFLANHSFYRTVDVFVTQTDVFMCMRHLLNLVQAGSWGDAIEYLSRFLPSDRRLGIHGRALFHFLRVHKAIDDIVTGAPDARSVAAALDQCIIRHPTKSHAIFSSLLWSRRFRAVLDLKRVGHHASLTVIDLVYETPELKEHMSPVRDTMEPQKVLPMGFGFRPRRHVKKPQGPAPASAVAVLYLQKKKMLPSSASRDHSEGLSLESLTKAKEWLVDLVEESLEAGKRSQEDLPQSAPKKGAPVTAVSQANLATFKRPLSDNSFFCKAKEWAVYLIDERLEAWPDMNQDFTPPFSCKDGDHVAQVLQTMPESLTSHAENSTTTSVREAGTCKDLIQEYYSCSRKNPRMELATVGESFAPKRRRTTLMSQVETGTGDLLAA